MHTSVVRSAAVRSTNRNLIIGKSKGKGKMREQYADESDEEATLLGHVERHGDGDVDAEDLEQATQLRHLEGSRLSRVRPIDPGTLLVRSYVLKAFLHPQQVAGPTRQISCGPVPSRRYVLNATRPGADNLVHRCQTDKFQSRFPPNMVRNQKYNLFTFFPLVLYEQFKFFFNLYFLLVALSQFIPALKIGALREHISFPTFLLTQ